MRSSMQSLVAAATFAMLAASYQLAVADPDPEVCYERCLELVEKGKIKDKKSCDFCRDLKKKEK